MAVITRSCRLGWGLLVALIPAWALAEEETLVRAQVQVQDGVYQLYSEVLISRPPPQVRQVLADYTRLPQINSGITAVRLLDHSPSGEQRMAVEATSCVALFCRTYRWVQAVAQLSDGSIQAVIEPQHSDFRQGLTRYRFLPHDHCTRLVFEARLEPVFWLPPFLGAWLIERKLAAEALETAHNIESYAQAAGRGECAPLLSP